MRNSHKVLVGLLAASTSFFVYKAQFEGERLQPYKDPVGVPTIGIGSTQYPPYYRNGAKVQMQDPAITLQQSRDFAAWHSRKDAEYLRQSLPDVLLSQEEFDVYLDFIYQYGRGTWDKSSMRRLLLQTRSATPEEARGLYLQACSRLLKYKYAGGKDCSIRKNGCYGVWQRQLWRKERCSAVNT